MKVQINRANYMKKVAVGNVQEEGQGFGGGTVSGNSWTRWELRCQMHRPLLLIVPHGER